MKKQPINQTFQKKLFTPAEREKNLTDMEHITKKLKQDLLFAKSWEPFDFKNLGQKAIKITYTSGDIDMLTTPMPSDKGSDKGDFKDDSEFLEFVQYLTSLKIPRT